MGESTQQPAGNAEGFDFDSNQSTDAADDTIDEFMDIGHNDAPPTQQPNLNYQPLTIQ